MEAALDDRVQPVRLTCEYETNPVGIDVTDPRLGWLLAGEGRDRRQSAYRILAATSLERLEPGKADLWDSGKVTSSKQVHVVYSGAPLRSRMRCYWTVRVWDERDRPSRWSEPAWWEMGLLDKGDWEASWIGVETGDESDVDLEELLWVWPSLPQEGGREAGEANDALKQAYLRKTFTIPKDQRVRRARLLLAMDRESVLFVNGVEFARSISWRDTQWVDLTWMLVPGVNVLAIEAHKSGDCPGVAGRLEVEFEGGAESVRVDIDTSWRSQGAPCEGWTASEFDDGAWACPQAVSRFAATYGEPNDGEARVHPPPAPCPLLRKEFALGSPVKRACLYATARGVYTVRLNGRRVGDARLAPGWTDYRIRTQVQTYDVTDLVGEGKNALAAELGDGWYAGTVGMFGRRRYGGYPLQLLAQLEIEHEDGSTTRVVTDGSWRGAAGPRLEADLIMGEIYDARLEQDGWDLPGYGERGGAWRAVQAQPIGDEALEAQRAPLIRNTAILRPVRVTRPEPGVHIFDMGQNMVGRIRLRVRAARGTAVVLRYGEMLEADGRLYVTNLRSARQTDVYVCRGEGDEVYEPEFTFHGFRYVEVRGLPGEPLEDTVIGCVLHSDTPPAGSLETSNALVNRLQRNIVWGQKGNFLSIPTDCPQRDERLGWTGDAQIFVRTACFNMDTARFFTKWLIDLEDAQREDGAFTDVAPHAGTLGAGTAAWGDAGIIVPWTMYLCYGDDRLIRRHWGAMARWIDYLQKNSEGLIRPAQGYGDWLSINADTPKDLIGTAYFAHSTRIMSRMAAAVGRDEDARAYQALFEEVRDAFNSAFVEADGRVKGETQTAYVLALHMDLLPEALRAKAARRLVDAIEERDWHLSTGFLGCGYLLPVLTETGYLDVAYRLLLNETFPSWGYTIRNGATTMWERWNSYTKESGFGDARMNSFNHYAYGSVGEWLYRYVAGIDIDPDRPGYRHILIRPRPGGGLTRAKAEYRSIRGLIRSEWRRTGDLLRLEVEAPPNTEATVHIPGETDGEPTRRIGSGVYVFESRMG